MATSPTQVEGSDDAPEEPPTPAEIRRHLETQRKPTTPQEYNTMEAAFWLHRHMPVGSVVRFLSMGEDGVTEEGLAAVLVTGVESLPTGIWLEVEFLGAEQEGCKKALQKYFKGKRRMVHLCYPDRDGHCPELEENGMHLQRFTWFPPGDFAADWLSAAARKKVKAGPVKDVASHRDAGPAGPGGPSKVSRTEMRLSALRSGRRRVSFSPSADRPREERGEPRNLAGYLGGAARGKGNSSSAPDASVPGTALVKAEVVDLTAPSRRSKTPEKKKSRGQVATALAQAALAHQKATDKKIKKERGRSRKRKRRSKRKQKDSDSGSSSSHRSSSSESSSLLPPLKRKSQKHPGSVLKLVEQQAFDFLAQDGILHEDDEASGVNSKPKLFTYYQLGLKPALDPKSRDAKELGLLCKALDALRDGRLDQLGDLLAARLIAVDTATRQGWATARHLEICTGEEEGVAPAHLLLQAQKHGRQVEKAGGKGSWSRYQSWGGEWYGYPDGRQKGKSKDQKGKGKKGKGKGKAGKPWNVWGTPGDKEKPDGKKAPEANG
eukprot:s3186_g1.t1